MFFCKGNKWQASFCSSIFHCFCCRLRLNLSEYQRRGETASPSVWCLKPWSFTLKVWGIVAANQQGLATAANQLAGFICIVVCIEYPFSNCQNVGHLVVMRCDTRWWHEVSLPSLYPLNATSALPMRYSGSKRIWQFAPLFSILSEPGGCQPSELVQDFVDPTCNIQVLQVVQLDSLVKAWETQMITICQYVLCSATCKKHILSLVCSAIKTT